MNSEQLIRHSGLTARQVDHWTTSGYLRADVANPGTGRHRQYTADEARIAKVMKRLVDAGLSVPAAMYVARTGPDLAPGIEVVVDRDRHPDGPTDRDVSRAALLVKRAIFRSPKARRTRAIRDHRKALSHR